MRTTKQEQLDLFRIALLKTDLEVLLTKARAYSLDRYNQTLEYSHDGYLGGGIYIDEDTYLQRGIEEALQEIHHHHIEYLHKEYGVEDEDNHCYCDEVYDVILKSAEAIFEITEKQLTI